MSCHCSPNPDSQQNTVIDWGALRSLAHEAMECAYAPYSSYPVGAAGLVNDGRLVSGCNVENAGLGVTLCAECGMISELIRSGGGRLVAVTCCNSNREVILPCGRCRQIIYEHGGPNTLLDTPKGILPMSEILPQAFGPQDLNI